MQSLVRITMLRVNNSIWFAAMIVALFLHKVHPWKPEIGRYYETPDYISHTDTRKGLMNRVYHEVRKYMLSRKAKLIKRTSGLSKGTLLDIGTGTGYFSNAMKERGWRVKAIEKSAGAFVCQRAF